MREMLGKKMGKNFFLILTFICIFLSRFYSQSVELDWVVTHGGLDFEEGVSIATDLNGNVYTTGNFQNTIDFDPGVGVTNLISNGSNDIFIQKLDTYGNLLWAVSFGGSASDGGSDVTTDNDGNVYISGGFQGIVDFDPGGAVFNLINGGRFILKLDSLGNFIWANNVVGASAYSIEIDAWHNVYTTGSFGSTVDFDPGVGVYNLTSTTFYSDIYVQKLDSNGNFIWGKSLGGIDKDLARSIKTDNDGGVYITGYVKKGVGSTSVDLDPGLGIDNYSITGDQDIFVLKLDSLGDYQWGNVMGGAVSLFTNSDVGYSITTDISNNVYLTGDFNGAVDFDPGPGIYNLNSTTIKDRFVLKLDASGNMIWANSFGGNSSGFEIVTNQFNDVFVTGHNSGTEIFIDKLDSLGNIEWQRVFGVAPGTVGASIATDNNGGIYVTGQFSNTIDFDPQIGVSNMSSYGTYDIFTMKLNECINPTSNISMSVCGDYTSSTGDVYSTSGIYLDTVSNSTGCDSLITYDLEINPIYLINDTISICSGDSIYLDGTFQIVNGIYYDTLSTILGCDSLIKTSLFVDSSYYIQSSINICQGDSILIFGEFESNGGVYYDSLNTVNGCDSVFEILLNINPIYSINDTLYICQNDSILIYGQYQSSAGIYYDSLNTINGCDSVLGTLLNVYPVYSINDTLSICQNDSVLIYGQYQSSAGIYYNSLNTINGCDSLLSTSLFVNLTYNLSDSIHLCEGDSVFLQGAFQTTSGAYYDSLKTINGCDSLIITILQITNTPPAPIVTDSAICFNQGIPNIVAIGSGLGTIEWYEDPNSTTLLNSLPVYTPNINSGGQYKYYIQETINGCSSLFSTVTLDVYNPTAIINTNPTSGTAPVDVSFINGSLNANWYAWNFGTGDTSNLFEPIYTYENGGLYIVELKVSDSFGCMDSTQITIEVIVEYSVSIPNTITPNDDGFNDAWVIDNIEQFPDHIVQIFNRNGSLVFETTNYQNEWKGQYNGNDLPATTYYYIIDLGSGEEILKGDLSIIRE